MKRDDMPFRRHWLYYLVLKYAVIVAAVVIALYTAYRVYSG
jgi:nitrogen fixation protein FixH